MKKRRCKGPEIDVRGKCVPRAWDPNELYVIQRHGVLPSPYTATLPGRVTMTIRGQ